MNYIRPKRIRKDLKKLRQMFVKPEKYLKEQATDYKIYEINMEQQFWDSKIDTDNFSFGESK